MYESSTVHRIIKSNTKSKICNAKSRDFTKKHLSNFQRFFQLPAVRSDLHRLQSPCTQKKLNPNSPWENLQQRRPRDEEMEIWHLMVQGDIWRSWCTIFGCWQLCCCLKCDATNILTTRWWFSTCPPSNVLIFNEFLFSVVNLVNISISSTTPHLTSCVVFRCKILALASKARTAARTFLFSSESVNEGHPDKLCDQVGAKRKGKLDGIMRSNRYFEL